MTIRTIERKDLYNTLNKRFVYNSYFHVLSNDIHLFYLKFVCLIPLICYKGSRLNKIKSFRNEPRTNRNDIPFNKSHDNHLSDCHI